MVTDIKHKLDPDVLGMCMHTCIYARAHAPLFFHVKANILNLDRLAIRSNQLVRPIYFSISTKDQNYILHKALFQKTKNVTNKFKGLNSLRKKIFFIKHSA